VPNLRGASLGRRTANGSRPESRFPVSIISLQVGAVSSPASQPAAPDFNGSDAMTLIST
jgi:hypothetical protein